eukprot:15477868-Alexandrium_andersonii.AAC.1
MASRVTVLRRRCLNIDCGTRDVSLLAGPRRAAAQNAGRAQRGLPLGKLIRPRLERARRTIADQ